MNIWDSFVVPFFLALWVYMLWDMVTPERIPFRFKDQDSGGTK